MPALLLSFGERIVQRIAVLGLGRFGTTLARQLGRSDAEVIAIDRNPNLVAAVKDDVALAVRLDSTDEEAVLSQDLADCDVCVVSIGENFEGALLTTSILKKIGVKRIICRAQTGVHAEIFRRIGADEIIRPETESGVNLARRLANPQFQDFIELADGYSLIDIRCPAEFRGKSLAELQLRTKYHVNLVALKRPVTIQKDGKLIQSKRITSVPKPEDVMQPDDILVLVGSHADLESLPRS